MFVWILEHGCRYEGGSVLSVHASEASGLKATNEYMEKSIAQTAELSEPDDPRETFFESNLSNDDCKYWIEHYRWQTSPGDWFDGDSDYLSLTRHKAE